MRPLLPLIVLALLNRQTLLAGWETLVSRRLLHDRTENTIEDEDEDKKEDLPLLLEQLEEHGAVCRILRNGDLVSHHAGHHSPVRAQTYGYRVGLAAEREAGVSGGPGKAQTRRGRGHGNRRRGHRFPGGNDFDAAINEDLVEPRQARTGRRQFQGRERIGKGSRSEE